MKDNKFLKSIVIVLLVFISTCFAGCNVSFDSNTEEKIVAGQVLFNGNGLSNVSIKSKATEFCKTDTFGKFSFKTKYTNMELYAEKEDYIFTETFLITETKEDIVFNADIIRNLNGTLTLRKINVKPIAILNLYNENYEYDVNGLVCLKAGKIISNINGVNVLNITETKYLEKNSYTTFEINDSSLSFEIDETKDLTLNFKLDAYVKINDIEEIINDKNLTIKKSNLKNDLIQNGKINFDIYGINSKTGGYTYNICFEFDYIEN